MVSFCARSKRLVPRSLQSRIASIFCGLLFFTLTASATFADTNSALDKLMSDAISQSQTMVSLMTNNCPGGSGGQNPQNYTEFVNNSNQVGQKLGDLRLALAKGQTSNAGPEIDLVVGMLERMVSLMNLNCPGGPGGRHPLNYGALVDIKNRVTGKLEAVKVILAG